MSKIPYVVRRGDTLYFRIRVPVSLQDVVQRREIVQTLSTQNRQQAIPIALELASEAKVIFNKLSRDMTDIKDKRHLEAIRQKLKAKDIIHQEEMEQKDLEKLREARSVKRETISKAENNVLKQMLLSGGRSVTPKKDIVKDKLETPKLTFVIDRYKKECGLGAPTLTKYDASYSVMVELMGDISVGKIDNFDILQLFVEICDLPNSMPNKKQRKKRGLKLRSLIDDNDGDCIHIKTFNSYKSNIKLLVEWAKKRYRGAFKDVNVAEVKYDGSRTAGELGQRSFNDSELEVLFRSKEMRSYCDSGKLVHKFWLPVIGLYTGARVGEICQINPDKDILEDKGTGIKYFLISQDTESAPDIDKSVKSGTSRVIPIHSRLIELGLFSYTDALKKAGHKRMFPLDKPRDRKAGGNTARNFTRYIEDVRLKDITKNKRIAGMHAFRKTIITKAYRERFIKGLLPIVGHEDDVRDETGKLLPDVSSDYIDSEAMKVPLHEKKKTIEKVVFDIDFYKPVKPIFKK